ncbi:MAG TPA: WecB/TagA/CpsF family glycosyltransferase [Planctomycetota bacterium]|nr:WecB/TagA/CpsF family glycosyltransferase [Planctomycetota bacterium]
MAVEKTSPATLMPAPQKRSEQVSLLGITMDNLSFDDAVREIIRMCRMPGPAYVLTPNVDHFMLVRKNSAFRAIYDNCHLCLADGMPVLWGARALGTPLKAKVSGSDLLGAICRKAAGEQLRVFFLGTTPEVMERASRALVETYPGLQIVGSCSPEVSPSGECAADAEVAGIVREARPHLLFVALGSPKQELWIGRHYQDLGVPVSIGVGASLDFVTGDQVRAPMWMQRAGFEWLWRLLHEPGRLWRRYLVRDPPFFWHIMRQWLRTRFRRRAT